MSKIELAGLQAQLPDGWSCQGMLTLTLPSDDKRVKPNVIVTKEYLPKEIELTEYFSKIKQSILKRGIQDMKISNEKDVLISGVRGKMMVCEWDVAQMAKMMGQQQGKEPPKVPEGQMVKQVQVTLLKDKLAVNMTASFPADQFDTFYKPFQEFLKTLKISG
ncbi:MAG: hypothetical protein Q7S68_02635 [Deltaproteobacteria bacterium]|nr:hypothetical protein [Deltaproteobacteria bacterium]